MARWNVVTMVAAVCIVFPLAVMGSFRLYSSGCENCSYLLGTAAEELNRFCHCSHCSGVGFPEINS